MSIPDREIKHARDGVYCQRHWFVIKDGKMIEDHLEPCSITPLESLPFIRLDWKLPPTNPLSINGVTDG